MFTKKIFTALFLAPLFVGCVVEDGDDDDGAGTDTDATATDPTATDPTATDPTATDPTVTATDPTAESSGTDPSVGTEGSESGSETADTGGSESGGEGGMFCQATCTEAVDCCAKGQPDCPGAPPFANWECNDGLCELGGCTSDDDCMIIAGTTCHQLSGFGACVPVCTVETEADDCLTKQGETCTGMADDGTLFCTIEAAPCEGDEDCGGFGVCNLDTGACECADAGQCPEGYDCVGG